MNFDLTNVAGVALVNVLIGGVFALVIKRPFVDALQKAATAERDAREAHTEIQKLKDGRVAGLEAAAAEHRRDTDAQFGHAAQSRKTLHEQLASIKATCVTREDCLAQHARSEQAMSAATERMVECANRVGVIEERVTATMRFASDINERSISMMQDLARLQGEQRKGGPR